MRRLLALLVLAAAFCSPASAFDFSRYGTTTYRDVTAGRLVAPRGSGAPNVMNLRSNPPDTGAYLSGNGFEFSFCPWTGCDQKRDINIAAGYLRGKTTLGIDHAETVLALDNYSNTGFVPKWSASTAYAVGAQVLAGAAGRLVYQATTGGTSAGGGTGPSGAGQAIADGSVVWKYLQNANDTDAKTALNITTAVGPNAGHTWGQAENVIMLPGVRTDLVVGHETDFGNHDQDCDKIGRNCFMNLWFANGERTSTAFVQASGGGDATPISADNSSGGAMLTGINFSGADTIRGVAFSDGTNSATTLKGYVGTRHVSGFINDQSTGPASYITGGNYSYATWSEASTAPYAVKFEGNYAVGAYRYKDTILGPWDGNGSYGALTFNGSFSASFMNGFYGKAADPNFYVNTQGVLQLKVLNQVMATVSTSGLNAVGDLNASGRILAPNLPTSGSGGGTVCADANGVFYLKKTPGACL